MYGSLAGVMGIIVSHPFDTIKTNFQEGRTIVLNPRVLYKGFIPPVFGVGLEKAVVFGTYELFHRLTHNITLSGAISDFTASVVVTPFERVNILLPTN